MKPIDEFLRKPKSFWACVRTLSQHIGYSKDGAVISPDPAQMAQAFVELEMDPTNIMVGDTVTEFGMELERYFAERSRILTEQSANLMDLADAKELFEEHFTRLNPTCPIPMNKQKGEKRSPAYLTGLVNMIVQEHLGDLQCNYDPRALSTITRDGMPLRTLSRRVDGAFPTTVNPIAIWEIKEYYHSKTFGSRVADGVYETLLDGMELEELRESEGIDVKHYLIVDAKHTWWGQGKPYLCRMFDMLHMGYVDEILFGREVVSELPRIVKEWTSTKV